MVDLSQYPVFLATAPAQMREYRTLEIYHPEFASPLRFVRDRVPVDLALEADAPRDPGATVTFSPLAMQLTEPSESQDGDVGPLQVELGAVGNEVQDALDQRSPAGLFTPIEVVYRKYYSGRLHTPVKVLYLSADNLSFVGYTAVGFSGADVDLANKSSGEQYTMERFQGLQGI